MFSNTKARKNLRVIDTTIYPEYKNVQECFLSERIPLSTHFDLNKVRNTDTLLKFMLPNIDNFVNFMIKYDLRKDDTIVCYDKTDMSHSSRVWWMLNIFGYKNVHVLNGGFQNWSNHSYPVSRHKKPLPSRNTAARSSDFDVELDKERIRNFDEMNRISFYIENNMCLNQIVDCRPLDEFNLEIDPLINGK
jgi:thiosulfate/3-mercaptopyruvate sulfurtransferase